MAPEIQLNVWIDAAGALLRLSVPAQALEIAREDVASAATRTTAFSIPGEESVRIPASGFGMAASFAKPATATGPLPAVILVSGSSNGDRDGIVAGIPVVGQIAADLVGAGIAVVRYDRRGTGQSGGRSETTTINDYAEDVRAIVTWLEKQRRDVDKRQIAIVGHGDGAWIAMTAAARDGRLGALVLASAASTVGSELVLERQRRVLDQLKTAEADKQAKIELQRKINAATTTGAGWDGIPVEMRRSAETPWFQSYLAFDPARVMRDVRQPVLIVQGALDSEVPPHHGGEARRAGACPQAQGRDRGRRAAVAQSPPRAGADRRGRRVRRPPRQAGVAGSDGRHRQLDGRRSWPSAQSPNPAMSLALTYTGRPGSSGDRFSSQISLTSL